MKKISYVLGILFAGCVVVFAQAGVTGTWRLEGVGPPFPREVVLRADGSRLTGMRETQFRSNASPERAATATAQ